MSRKNRHLTLPPSKDQAERIRAISRAAAYFGCGARVYPAKDRPLGTMTVVFVGPLPRKEEIVVLAYMFPDGVPNSN